MRATVLIVLCALAASCATLRAPLGGRTWNSVCYQALQQDVDHLAGAAAYDCGLLRLDAAQGAQSQITACAKQAVADGAAYRFGYQSAGDDSIYCSIAVRAVDGQLYALYVDQDVTGQWGQRGDHSAISISRCTSLKFERGSIGPGSFFATSGCEQAADVLQDLIARRR